MSTRTMNPLRSPGGERIPVPTALHDGVQLAADLLDRDLAEVDEQFRVTREWNYGGASPGVYDWVDLVMTAEVAGARVGKRLFPTDLADGAAIRRALNPTLVEFARQLGKYVDRHFDEIWRGLRSDLAAYAAAEG